MESVYCLLRRYAILDHVCSFPLLTHAHAHHLHRVIKVAKDFVDGVTFAVSSTEQYAHELEQLGLKSEEEVVAGLFDKQGRKYSMADKFRWVFNELFLQQ